MIANILFKVALAVGLVCLRRAERCVLARRAAIHKGNRTVH
jgi:hypothetical protein